MNEWKIKWEKEGRIRENGEMMVNKFTVEVRCRRPVWKALIGSYSNIAAIKKFLSPVDELELSLLCSAGSKIRGRRSIHWKIICSNCRGIYICLGRARARESRLLFPFLFFFSFLFLSSLSFAFADAVCPRFCAELREYLFRPFVCEKEAKLRS